MFEIRPYWYFIDIDEVPTQSTHTLGSELSGEIDIGSPDSIAYKLEFAQQSDHSHNPDSYSANYFRLDLQWLHSPITLGIGHEILGSNSEHIPLSTPLATLHAWNGWADIFLTTPVLGLRDTYAFLAVDFEKVEVLPLQASVYYHEFVSDRGDIEYGSEWDALLRTRVIENVHTSIKFARYEAHSLGNDVTKVMAYVEYNLKYTL
jgi:hypothetical protein